MKKIIVSVVMFVLLCLCYKQYILKDSPGLLPAKASVNGAKLIPQKVYKGRLPQYAWTDDALYGDRKIVFMTALAGCPYSAKRRGNIDDIFKKNPGLKNAYRQFVKMVGNSENIACSGGTPEEVRLCVESLERVNFLFGTCGSTYNFCIINPATKEYVASKNTDVAPSLELLEKYADW